MPSWSNLINTRRVTVSNVRLEDGYVFADLAWTHARYGPQVGTVSYLHRFYKWRERSGPLTLLAVSPFARTLQVQTPDGRRYTVRAGIWHRAPACWDPYFMDRYLAKHPDPNERAAYERRTGPTMVNLPHGPRRPSPTTAATGSDRRSPSATH
jgi:hypothetical protein